MARSRVRESASEIARQLKTEAKKERARLEREVDELAGQMRDYAVSISPEDTGEYKDSFAITKTTQDGLPARTLSNTDEIANIIEYGSEDTEEYAVLRRTEEHFRGQE